MLLKPVKHYTELIKNARAAEEEGELEKAASFYEEAIRQHQLETVPYSRLMIIYRKLKQEKDELRVIDAGLKRFQDHYDDKPSKLLEGHPGAEKLSRALFRKVSGKEGTYYPEPIPGWIKRRENVQKKLDGKPARKTRKTAKK
jgi:hypothetical protein